MGKIFRIQIIHPLYLYNGDMGKIFRIQIIYPLYLYDMGKIFRIQIIYLYDEDMGKFSEFRLSTHCIFMVDIWAKISEFRLSTHCIFMMEIWANYGS